MKKFLSTILLLCNVIMAFAQQIPSANHNLGCTSASDGPVAGVSDVNVILPAGNRTSNVSGLNQQNWGIASTSTTTDNDNHTIFKFSTSADWQSGGFAFSETNISKSNYIHIAVYAETGNQTVKIRLTSPGGQDGTYTQFQVDSHEQSLNQGWNYLNIPLSDFTYDGASEYHFKVTQVGQVGFIFSTGGRNLYIDDIYFYSLPIVAANHNLGCAASTGDGSDAVEGITNVRTILPVDGRNPNVTYLEPQVWDNGVSTQITMQDASGNNLYKFIPGQNFGNGGFYFQPTINASRDNTYLHAALYAEAETHVQIRLATPGGSNNNGINTYPQYEVNTTQLDLKPGWNYLNLLVDVNEEDRQITNNQEGFAYWAVSNFNFDKEKIQQVGFVITEGNHSIYADDIYFYELPYTTVDNDGENIDWNSSSGTTCQVKRVFQTSDEPDEEEQNKISNAYDANNSTYYGVSTIVSHKHETEDKAFYIVAELNHPITVSDIEMVWGNGYPIHYEAYALNQAPADWSTASVKAVLDEHNRLFDHTNDVVSYEPYYNTYSELDKTAFQTGQTRYVVIKMWEPMGSTFGFKLDEIHVGAYDDEYYTPDHISASDLNFPTEKANQVPFTLTVRNRRNSILTNRTITSLNFTVEDGNDRYVTIDHDGEQANVWATKPGNYVVDVTGTVDGVDVPNVGKVKLIVYRDWRGKDTNTKSMIQDLDAGNFFATSTEPTTATENYDVKNISDDKLNTRWSSGIHGTAENQFVTIKLSDTEEYKVRDMEFVWERAYPATYAVYGFKTLPEITAGSTTYDAFMTANSSRLLYEANLPKGHDYFPYRDLHVSGTGAGEVNNTINDSKYIVVAFKEPVEQQNGDTYGVSLWEMYAQATNMTLLNQMTKIEAQNKNMYVSSQDAFTIKALNGNSNDAVVVERLNDATFAPASADNSKNLLATTITEDNGVYTIKSTIDGTETTVGEIWDAGNNTYSIKTGTDKNLAGKKFNITVNYAKEGKNLSTTFALSIIKKPMELLPTSTSRNLVFDDGYYVEERLEKYATPDVMSIDLTNVDFTTDYADHVLSATAIPAPRRVNYERVNGKWQLKGDRTTTIGKDLSDNNLDETIVGTARKNLNPNVVYYVNQNAFDGSILKAQNARVHGDNVVLKDNRGTATNDWYIDNLTVFDGYDFAPASPSVAPDKINAHNAYFYTNIPANKKTTLVLPFDIRNNELDDIKFYTPTALTLKDDQGAITLSESNEEYPKGNTIYIIESATDQTSHTGGFGTVFVSTSYNDGTNTVEVSKTGASQVLPIGDTSNNATLESSFYLHHLTDDGYYLYSAATETFRPANDDWFNYKDNPQNADKSFKDKDLRNILMPFYACLHIPSSISVNAAPAKISWVIGGTTTGITDIQTSEANRLNPDAPMYDLMGRRVSKAYRGIVIQNGKKYTMR